MKKSLLYMLVEGVSRGIPQVILLYLAFTLAKNNFAILTLLYGLESLLVILLPSNYIELLYKLHNNENKNDLAYTILTMNVIVVTLLIMFALLAEDKLTGFYNYNNIYVYIAIIFSALINSYMRFSRTQYQLNFQHNEAIKIMLYSFGFANIGMISFLFIFDDKIMAFFIGKALGFIAYFIFYIYKVKIKLYISQPLLADYLSRMKYLFVFSIYSWFFGYGFSYITKIIGTENDVANIGYIITFSMPFLLLANGINQVYTPKVRKLIHDNFNLAIIFSKKILYLYIGIFLSVILISGLINNLEYPVIKKFNYLFVISAVIFLFSSYKYVYDVYIYVYDQFEKYILGTMIIETFTMLFIILTYYVLKIDLVYLYPLLILSRSAYVYKLIVKIRSKQVC